MLFQSEGVDRRETDLVNPTTVQVLLPNGYKSTHGLEKTVG